MESEGLWWKLAVAVGALACSTRQPSGGDDRDDEGGGEGGAIGGGTVGGGTSSGGTSSGGATLGGTGGAVTGGVDQGGTDDGGTRSTGGTAGAAGSSEGGVGGSAGSISAGQGGSAGRGGSGTGGGGAVLNREFIRYDVDGVTVEVDPYYVVNGQNLLAITSHEPIGQPYLSVGIEWGFEPRTGSFTCGPPGVPPSGTRMAYTDGSASWQTYVAGGSCRASVSSVMEVLEPYSEATGTFSGTLVSPTTGASRAITNGSFLVRYLTPG